jgi:hypothetical protein
MSAYDPKRTWGLAGIEKEDVCCARPPRKAHMLERKLEAIRFLGGKVISLIDNPEEVAMQHAAVQVPDLTSQIRSSTSLMHASDIGTKGESRGQHDRRDRSV